MLLLLAFVLILVQVGVVVRYLALEPLVHLQAFNLRLTSLWGLCFPLILPFIYPKVLNIPVMLMHHF